MPVESEIGTGVHFRARFLQIVLTEGALAKFGQGANALCRLGFARDEQGNAAGWASVSLLGAAQALAQRLPACGERR